VAILFCGDTFTKICALFGTSYSIINSKIGILGMRIGSESFYNRTVVSDVDDAVADVTEKFLNECRNNTPHRDKVR
jgi:hypothetical protein